MKESRQSAKCREKGAADWSGRGAEELGGLSLWRRFIPAQTSSVHDAVENAVSPQALLPALQAAMLE